MGRQVTTAQFCSIMASTTPYKTSANTRHALSILKDFFYWELLSRSEYEKIKLLIHNALTDNDVNIIMTRVRKQVYEIYT